MNQTTLNLEYRNIEALIPYTNNSRTHSDAQVTQIAASIREFGWTNPVLVDGDNGIIAGHGRVLAARKLGMDSVPVIELAHLNEAQRRAYIIADNKLAENAGWDDELLRLELGALRDLDFDLSLTGFESNAIDKLLDMNLDIDEGSEPTAIEYALIVEFDNEADQMAVFDEMGARGFKCKLIA